MKPPRVSEPQVEPAEEEPTIGIYLEVRVTDPELLAAQVEGTVEEQIIDQFENLFPSELFGFEIDYVQVLENEE